MLASVAAMQGRIAMWHALGEAVQPLGSATWRPRSSPTPRSPPSASSQAASTAARLPARVVKLPLATNARAKMAGLPRRLRQVLRRPATGLVLGGVVVAPAGQRADPAGRDRRASSSLTVDQIAHTFSVYPSLSGCITEAARSVMEFGTDAII